MTLTPGTYRIGPETGSLRLRTARQGVAARVGHDLLIEFGEWSGTLTSTGPDASVVADIELASFTIVEGTGGVAPLSTYDRKTITATAMKLLEVDRHPRAMFGSTTITASADGGTIDGDLTVRDRTTSVSLAVSETGPSAWRATGAVLQSAFGITPYRAFLGALRVADAVGIEVTVDLDAD